MREASVREAHDPDDVAFDGISETEVGDVAPRDEIAIAEGEEESSSTSTPRGRSP